MRPIVVCVVGTRPEAVKMAPIVLRLRRESAIATRLIASGQHRGMLDRALADFGLTADRDLDLMRPGQSLSEITARGLTALTDAFSQEKPDLVLAQGDTTTVLAAGLACHYSRIPFGHVEAGLRTGDRYRPFPEEINRALASRLAEIHFAPTPQSRANLLREGIATETIFVTGNPVIDALRFMSNRSPALPVEPPSGRFLLVTAHRRENWGEPMRQIAAALRDLVDRDEGLGIVFPAHPNPEVRRPMEAELGSHPRVRLIEPVGYPAFVALMSASAMIVSDSGGIQEEGPALGKSVVVLREETERPEALGSGLVSLVRPEREAIVAAVEARARASVRPGVSSSPFGDGWAAERIARVVLGHLGRECGPVPEGMPEWPPAD